MNPDPNHDAAPPMVVVPASELPAVPATLNAEGLLVKALEHNVPIETMERLLALRATLHAEQARGAFFAALAAFQGECPIIPKTKTAQIKSERGTFSYTYAPLDVIVRHVGPILQRHGLSYTVETAIEEAGVLTAACTVHHVAGHSESSTFRVPIDKGARMNDAQKVASASTYAKRYAFCNALGILTGDEDNDAHGTDGTSTGSERRADTMPPRPQAKAAPGSPDPHIGMRPRPAPAEADGDTPADSMGATVAEVFPDATTVETISAADHRKLEATIRDFAKAWGEDGEALRTRLKDRVGKELGCEHLNELSPEAFVTVMGWLAARPKRKRG